MLIATAFPQRNEVRACSSLGSMEIAQWIVRAAAPLSSRCMHALLHQDSCLGPHCDLQSQSGKSAKRYRPLVAVGMAYGLVAEVNPLTSSETTVLKTRFGPADADCPLSRFIAFDRNQLVDGRPLGNYRGCYRITTGLPQNEEEEKIAVCK